jgi:hypothetical protein
MIILVFHGEENILRNTFMYLVFLNNSLKNILIPELFNNNIPTVMMNWEGCEKRGRGLFNTSSQYLVGGPRKISV